MKNFFLTTIVVLLSISSYSQFETDLTPDSLDFDRSHYFCSDHDEVHFIANKSYSTYYYFKYQSNNYEHIPSPYPLDNNNTYAMEIFDNNCYHLTNQGIYIYQENGIWDSLLIDNQAITNAKGIFKDGANLYLNFADTLAYYNGTGWSFFEIPSNGSYSNFIKHEDDIYFRTRYEGIFKFDGSTVEHIIAETSIQDFEIYNNRIWYNLSNKLHVTDLNGNNVDPNLSVTTPYGLQALHVQNSRLYILSAPNYPSSKLISIHENDVEILFSTNDASFSSSKVKMSSFDNCLLSSIDDKLTLLNPQEGETFGALQPGISFQNLDVNMVDAYYMNRGQMFWDGIGEAKYEVPKGSGKTAAFTGGLWFAGENSNNNNSHVAVARFNTSGHDFFPGPLKSSGNEQGQTDSTYSQSFDRIWKVSVEDIQSHIQNYQTYNYIIPENIATWPAHGNTAENYAENLAPFVDSNENGIYEPELGEYPCIKGDMALYWIFNDNLSEHSECPGGTPLGIEVHAQAYAFNCDTCQGLDTAINYTTFLSWKVINRSINNYTNFNTSFWTDADLGDSFDDYIGTHVGLNSMYLYNGDDIDGDGDPQEYGENPPAFFTTVLDAPYAEGNDGIDNDNDGTIDESMEKSLLKAMMYFNNAAGVNGDPTLPEHYVNYLNAKWKDGRPLTYGGTGYQATGGTPAKYMFPGESDPWMNGTNGIDPAYPTEGGWTEENEANQPYDRRGLATIGSSSLNSGATLEYTIAFVWSRAYTGSAWASVEKGFQDVQAITDIYNNTDLHSCDYLALQTKAIQDEQAISIFPNPIEESFIINNAKSKTKYNIFDLQGKLLLSGTYNGEMISTEALNSGVYILELENNNSTQSIKLIKE